MKLISLSKAIRTLGAIATLSLMFGIPVQPPAQAQTVAQDDNGVCTVLPEGVFYQEFGGITFSPEQKVAYRKIEAVINARYEVISANAQTIVIPDGGISIFFKEGIGDPKAFEIVAANDNLIRQGLSATEQVEQLTEKYGQYAEFQLAMSTVYTPEQIAEGQQIGLDFEAQTMAILTPGQQPIYQANLALQRKIQACGEPTPFNRIISPLPY
jgi:hypothetical protein